MIGSSQIHASSEGVVCASPVMALTLFGSGGGWWGSGWGLDTRRDAQNAGVQTSIHVRENGSLSVYACEEPLYFTPLEKSRCISLSTIQRLFLHTHTHAHARAHRWNADGWGRKNITVELSSALKGKVTNVSLGGGMNRRGGGGGPEQKKLKQESDTVVL